MRGMISSRSRYALRALLDLSQHPPGKPVLVNEIAGRQNIPLNFLHQILLDLKLAGLVTSRKGPGGGFTLARPPEEITLADVLKSIEGPTLALACQGSKQDCACPHPEACAIRNALAAASEEMERLLRETSLATLRADQSSLDTEKLSILDFTI